MPNSRIEDFIVRGLVAATFTPFDAELKVDYNKIGSYAAFLTNQGVKSVFINGSTGEGANLTIEERINIAEKWKECAADKLDNIMVHVGGANLLESITLAKHAEQICVSAIGLVAPTYFKPQSEDALVEYCRRVAESAPTTPFYYYHIPSITGLDFVMDIVMDKLINTVPTFRGIKFSHTDYMDLHQCFLKEDSKYNLLFGCDQQLLCAMALGVDAAIGSTYNYMPRIYIRMADAFEKGDLITARKELDKAQKVLIQLLKTSSHMSAFKTAMKLAGFDVGPVRPVLTNLDSKEAAQLEKTLVDIGYKNWIS